MRGAMLGILLATTGCGAGSCWSSGGIVDECKEGWSRTECADWDQQQVNSAAWTFSSRSCDALGFGVQCSDGSWVTTASDC